jgi:hypothetical protein
MFPITTHTPSLPPPGSLSDPKPQGFRKKKKARYAGVGRNADCQQASPSQLANVPRQVFTPKTAPFQVPGTSRLLLNIHRRGSQPSLPAPNQPVQCTPWYSACALTAVGLTPAHGAAVHKIYVLVYN